MVFECKECGFVRTPEAITPYGKTGLCIDCFGFDYIDEALEAMGIEQKKKPAKTKLTRDQQIRAKALELLIMSYGEFSRNVHTDDLMKEVIFFEDYIREGRKG